MGISNQLIYSGSTGQVIQLSTGWLITYYQINDDDSQFIYSTNEGASWSNLCRLYYPSGSSTDYVLAIDSIIADGANVMVVFGYGDINNNDRLSSVYFNPTTVNTSTNLYNLATHGGIHAWLGVDKARLEHGRYQYLQSSLVYDDWGIATRYKRHISTTNTSPPFGGSAYLSSSSSAVMTGDADLVSFANGEAWVFYGSSNTLQLRRRLTPTGAFQTAQILTTLADATMRITRVNVVEQNGTIYVFFSWRNTANTSVGFGYMKTNDGLTFSSLVTLLDNPYSTTSDQFIDFDLLVDGNNVAFLLAIPNGANRLLYTGKFHNDVFTTKSTGLSVANAISTLQVIQRVTVNNRLLLFTAKLANGTNLTKFRLDVDGIKQLVSGSWTNIEQAQRFNGSTWQEQNGKLMVSSVWKDIT